LGGPLAFLAELVYVYMKRQPTSTAKRKAVTRDVVLTARVTREVMDAASRAAADDDRTVSQLVSRVLLDWLRERSYLNKPKR
jgi:hypothetical protein